jgi:hypothetical protein
VQESHIFIEIFMGCKKKNKKIRLEPNLSLRRLLRNPSYPVKFVWSVLDLARVQFIQVRLLIDFVQSTPESKRNFQDMEGGVARISWER